MVSRGWRYYSAAAVAAVVAYLFVPVTGWWQTGFAVGIGNFGAVAILIGAHKLPRSQRLPWWILAFGVFCSAFCSAFGGVLISLSADTLNGPDLSDYCYLAFYPLLKEAAAAWHACLRRSDILARYGGEEFIVLLPGADIEQATAALGRLQAAMPPGATFSAGVATWDRTETSEELVARADAALYAAKNAGRDRVFAALAA